MKLFNYVLFCLISISIHSQDVGLSDRETIHLKMSQINEALITKDTSALAKLLHKDLSLGHSNGWIETKSDLLETLVNEGVTYLKIENTEPFSIHHTSEDLITTRRKIDVKGLLNTITFEVKLNVLEVWICENESWQLLARQSVNLRD